MWDFNDSTVMNNRLNKIFPICTTSEKNYPYCAILAQVRLDKKLQVNMNSTKKLINKKLKYATPVHKGTRTLEATHSVFKPFTKTEKTCLNFFTTISPVQSPKEEQIRQVIGMKQSDTLVPILKQLVPSQSHHTYTQ